METAPAISARLFPTYLLEKVVPLRLRPVPAEYVVEVDPEFSYQTDETLVKIYTAFEARSLFAAEVRQRYSAGVLKLHILYVQNGDRCNSLRCRKNRRFRKLRKRHSRQELHWIGEFYILCFLVPFLCLYCVP